jgi:hypothetical protein
MQRVRDAARTHRQPKPIVQQGRDLPVREAELLIEERDQRDRLRTKVRTCGAERVRCLERMAPLDTTMALPALAHMHAKPPHMRVDDRQLFLDLLGHARFSDRAATVRTSGRQRHVNGLVDVARRAAMAVAPVTSAGAPTRSLRLAHGRAFRERRGLPFTRPARGRQFLLQLIVLTLQSVPGSLRPLELTLQPIDFSVELLERGWFRRRRRIVRALGHAPVMPESAPQYKRDPLTNYVD